MELEDEQVTRLGSFMLVCQIGWFILLVLLLVIGRSDMPKSSNQTMKPLTSLKSP